ncbi:MAG: outer membrane lipid asymmetry maintenance protein MlaD [Gammaproteobacteria bacterium]|nr:outer membrane lipid asymmetry maintenance protein MlaD [Gammaproteobacteria bacterium]MDH5799870.1 outer membrane lipid asymmetry maintenance protein MlaD [Gammaproteobacteria bacterium]
MEQSKTVQVWVGVFVAIGIASLFMLAMKVSNISALAETEGYELKLKFENIGGLKVRSPVTMAGVVVGRVAGIGFDRESYEAVVTVRVEQKYDNIPDDTSASIYTAGLLGEQYIGLEPGGSETYLKPGDTFKLTQSAVVLEKLIGQFLVNKADE